MENSIKKTNKNRNTDFEISFMQTLGVMLVVAEHSFNYMDEPPYLCDWVYQFSMPMFVFISGYLLKNGFIRKNMTPSNLVLTGKNGFIANKVKRLLVPYFILNTLIFIPKAMLSKFSLRPVDLSVGNYLDMLVYPYHNVVGTLWFLFTIFMILLLAVSGLKLMAKLRIKIHPAAIIAMLAIISIMSPENEMIFNIHAIMRYMVFMAAGYYARSTNIKEKIRSHATTIFSINFPLTFILALTPDFTGREIITATNGIFMMMSAAILYNKKGLRLINHLYGTSYTIYIYSWFIQVIFLQIMMKVTGIPGAAASALAIIGGIYIPFLFHKWIVGHKNTVVGKSIAFISGIKI